MRTPAAGLATLAGLAAALAPAAGVADVVIDRASSWDAAGARIYTDVLLQKDDGTTETLRVPGGVVGDVGMVQFHSIVGEERLPSLLGFVPSRTRAGTPLRWAANCVSITPEASGTEDLAGDREFSVMGECAGHWEDMTGGCGYLRFTETAPQKLEVGYDGVNLIIFRETEWCAPPRSACEPKSCYKSAAAGVTTVFFVDRMGADDDGVILDADVELNAVDYAIWDQGTTLGDSGSPADLANTLTHELGHVIGLAHNCTEDPNEPALDDQGNPAVSCDPGIAPQEVLDATMYAYQTPEGTLPETKKATLEPDDVNAFCARYPTAEDPGECRPAILRPGFVGGCTCKPCAVGGTGAPGGAGVVLAAIGVLVVGRRARARRRG